MAKALLATAWPYMTRLLEDNCRPGAGIAHPPVKPYWDPFKRISTGCHPGQPAAHYGRWLVGEISTLDEVTLKTYTRRWALTRRRMTGRTAAAAPVSGRQGSPHGTAHPAWDVCVRTAPTTVEGAMKPNLGALTMAYSHKHFHASNASPHPRTGPVASRHIRAASYEACHPIVFADVEVRPIEQLAGHGQPGTV